MNTIDYPEDFLYFNNRHHTKKIVIVSGTAKSIEGLMITTKSKNNIREKVYLTTLENGKNEYFVLVIKKKNRGR